MKKRNSILLLLLITTGISAQMPDTEIWLFGISEDKAGKLSLQKPRNISQRKGYDNQPSFSSDSKLFYYSSDSLSGTEIFSYDPRKKKTSRVSHTEESEYSPQPLPVEKKLAAVVVEKDSSQKIHFLSIESGRSIKSLPNDSIGYFTFLNADTLVFYKLTQPHSLRWCTLNGETENFIAAFPTRTFKTINRHQLIYGIRDSALVNYYIYDFALRKARHYASHSPGSEDIFWHRKFGLVISLGKQLARYDAASQSWQVLFDLSSFGLNKITRFVFDSKGKYLVVVDNPK